MKNLQNLDENGKPMSRGYGFVSFTKPDHALAALRAVNNNPEVFTSDQVSKKAWNLGSILH